MDGASRIAFLPLKAPPAWPAALDLLPRPRVVTCPRGGSIGMAGAGAGAAGGLGAVIAGTLVSRFSAPDGRAAVVTLLRPGEILGRLGPPGGAIEPDHNLCEEVRALERSVVATWPADAVARAAEAHPELARWLLLRSERRSRRLERRLAEALTLPVCDRVRAVLVSLAAEFGRMADGRARLELPLTQETLAELAGATRESTNRAIARLSRRGVVERDGRAYLVRLPGHEEGAVVAPGR